MILTDCCLTSRKFSKCRFHVFVILSLRKRRCHKIMNKIYAKIKFNVRYVVSVLVFFVHALQPNLSSIKHVGVRPWKMGASLIMVAGFFFHRRVPHGMLWVRFWVIEVRISTILFLCFCSPSWRFLHFFEWIGLLNTLRSTCPFNDIDIFGCEV